MKSAPIAPKPRRSTREDKSARPLTLGQIVRVLQKHLPEFTEQYGVKSLGVFGSFLYGEQTATSDLDLLVEFRDETPFEMRHELYKFLRAQFGIDIDLIENRNLKPFVGRLIRREVVWLQKDGVRQPIKLSRNGRKRNNRANMKSKREYLDLIQDMLDSMENAKTFASETEPKRLLNDRMRLAAIKYEIQTIGEAASKIPASIQARYPQIHWNDIIGMRNRLVHDYGRINLEILWEILNKDIPNDQMLIADMLKAEKKRRAIDDEKTNPTE